MTTELMEPRLLTVKQAAQLANLSQAKIYECLAEGDLPRTKIGRSLRIHVDDLEAWMRKHVS